MPKWKGLNHFQLEQAHLKNVENTDEIAVFVGGFFHLVLFFINFNNMTIFITLEKFLCCDMTPIILSLISIHSY